jgi:hypothetical protein
MQTNITISGMKSGSEICKKEPVAEISRIRRNVMQTRAVAAKVFYVVFATCFCACLGRAQILISADQEDSIHTGKMHTHVSISGNGHLDATTRSWADNISGFTGSVAVVVLDQSQRLLWVSGTQVCGVSGFSHRTCNWSDTVPADKLSQVRYIAIKHKYTPKREDLGAWLQGLGNDISRELAGLVHRVETASIGSTPGAAAGSPPPPHQQCQPSGSQSSVICPFDLMWDMGAARESSGVFSGVDANGLPVNPLWSYQLDRDNRGTLPDFGRICGPSFPNRFTVNDSTLAEGCTSQQPTADFPSRGLSALYCPLSSGGVMTGHLNWGLATYVGTLDWEEYESVDGDFNFKLNTPNNAALTYLNDQYKYGLHLEFNNFETILNFRTPFWTTLYNNMGCTVGLNCNPNNEALTAVSGKVAVVTGLIGIDGVHGGYTESHPVFSLAIKTQEQAEAGAVDDSWAFFLRNSGGEGDCSSHMHYWNGLPDASHGGNWYFIQLPAPPGATGVSVVPSSSDVWTNLAGITGPVITRDSAWTYIGFQLPSPESGPELDGQISLHYTLPSGAPPPAHPPMARTSARLVKANPTDIDGDGWEELRKRITNPADLKAFDDTLRAERLATVRAKPHTLELHVPATIAQHHPVALTTAGHKGILTRDRAVQDPVLASARNALDQKMLRVIPKANLPPNVNLRELPPR